MRKYLFLILFLFGISFVFADCCFDVSNGLCTENADSSSCSTPLFSGSCSAVSDCEMGCCALGIANPYSTQRECQVLSNSGGFDFNWQQGSAAQCAAQQNMAATGACVVLGQYENSCTIKTRAQCSANFYEGLYCTDPSFNTTCEQTSISKCVGEDAYYFDSCGNQERVKEDCNYASGTLCRQNNITREASCRSLNCPFNGTTKTNGESWCILENPQLVGSRYFRDYCMNGEIVTEPCADYRMESCIMGAVEGNTTNSTNNFPEAKCESNPWQDCLDANNVGGDSESESGDSALATAEKIAQIKEACNPEYCEMFEAARAHCVSGANGEGFCTHGDDTSKWYPALITGESFEINSDTSYAKDQISNLGMTYGGKDDDLLKSLGLSICVPLIPGGLEIASSGRASDSVCSLGNFQTEVVFRRDCDKSKFLNLIGTIDIYCNWGLDIEKEDTETRNKLKIYQALTTGSSSSWQDWEQIFICKHGNEYCQMADDDASSMPVNPAVLGALNARCAAISDCAGKANWIEVGGSGTSSGSELTLSSNGGWTKTYEFTYTCSSWKAPIGGDSCSQCGADDLPCSEYRCKSLGKKCEYFEPAGIDRGYCISSTDNSPPTISYLQNPANPIPPFSPVTFTINTNEDSSCRFNLGSAGNSLSGMPYQVDNEFSRSHNVTLTLPGVRAVEDSGDSQFELINRDGNYSIYVRCEDPAGNWNLNAYLIRFNVMTTPDNVPPTISNFIPSTNSAVRYNYTNKSVSFRLNEPSECKWSLTDNNFSSMENSFNCDTNITDYSVLNGYRCNGVLTNVTQNLTQSTNYFIRCKDQPWLEGREDNLYKRNVNPTSFAYSLRPSQLFEITSLQPSGEITVGNSVTNITLSATTRGGGYNGVANCSYRLYWNNTITGFDRFRNTNSISHTTTLTNKTEGDYVIEVRCVDLAGNEQIRNTTIYFRYDTATPWIVRVYNDKGNLKLNTNENAVCRFVKNSISNLACLSAFQQQNSTIMTGKNAKEHLTSWIKGISYYVKCKDFYNNEDAGCFIARAEK